MTNLKQYLGDSVYADIQDGMLKLTTENGAGANNTIYLESEVVNALLRYLEWVKEKTATKSL